MKNNSLLFVLYFIIFSISHVFAQKETINKIDEYISQVKQENNIPGVSVCIVKDDAIFYKKHFGHASIEHDVPLSEQSIFRVYSLTKTVISVAIFQLIEKGKLSLEDPISKYISGVPNSWKSLQIKYLLTHSSGLPDMRVFGSNEQLTEEKAKEKAFKEEFTFARGDKYSYNQTNFWLLHRIIEKITNKKLEDFIRENQFEGEKDNVFFSSDSKQIIKNRVTSYFPFSTGKMIIDLPTIEGDYMYAANGLNITLNEFVKWDKRLRNNELLKESTKLKMWEEFPYQKSNKIFTYAWDKFFLNYHESYGFTGSLITAYRIFPKDNISVFILSNGLGEIYDIDDVVDHVANIVNGDIYNMQEPTFNILHTIVLNQGFEKFKKKYFKIKNGSQSRELDLEDVVNSLGYTLLRSQKNKDALKMFIFNTKEYPNSANVYDSLGEIYLMQKQYDLAEENYKKAIALGGTNGNAKEMLEKIKAK